RRPRAVDLAVLALGRGMRFGAVGWEPNGRSPRSALATGARCTPTPNHSPQGGGGRWQVSPVSRWRGFWVGRRALVRRAQNPSNQRVDEPLLRSPSSLWG